MCITLPKHVHISQLSTITLSFLLELKLLNVCFKTCSYKKILRRIE